MAKKVFVQRTKLPPKNEIVSTDIYVDEYGQWSAKIGNDSHETAVLSKLREWIDAQVKRQREPHVEYVPFIEIMQVRGTGSSYSDRDPDASLRFWFEVVLLSKDIYEESKSNGKINHFRLKRPAQVIELKVYEDLTRAPRYGGDKRRDENYEDHEGDGRWSRIVEFTPQRYQAVCAIRDKIIELRERLNDLLVRTDGAADMLDKIPVMALLAPPEKKS